MGQLRTALIALHQTLTKIPSKLDKVTDDRDQESDRIVQLSLTAQEGWHAIHTYLVARFQKEGTTIDANKKKTMKELLDPELTNMGKGLEQWRKDLINHCNKASSAFADSIKTLRDEIDSAAAESKRLRGITDKKKAKWFKSSKYKAKIKGYLDVLDNIDGTIDSQIKALDKAKGLRFDEAWVNKYYQIKSDTTVEQIEDMTSMDHKGIMENYFKNQDEQDKYVHKWRDEYKAMGAQIATMKKWIEDADQMEAESTE